MTQCFEVFLKFSFHFLRFFDSSAEQNAGIYATHSRVMSQKTATMEWKYLVFWENNFVRVCGAYRDSDTLSFFCATGASKL